ncbi:DUF4113 domain-containing protein [Dyadobacter sp. CY327]|uniref:DUF4113 domain-containing protein n=1 Tax=Dyadobacter sp. CY327 TaxID=2907301 RepID=UPI0021079ACD|nr:DUF4113 domain-containing protein [Dyadobacter sp. CY327]
MAVVDNLNNSMGQNKVLQAGQGLDTRWKMKQNKLSPRYNTRIQEIITIHAKQSLKQTANLDNYFKDKQKGLELS